MHLILGSHSAVAIADLEARDVTVRHELVSPTFVTVAPDRDHVYAVSEDPAGPGRVFILRGDDLRAVAGGSGQSHRATGGDGPCHLTVHPGGAHLLVSHYRSGSLAVLPINGSDPPRVARHHGAGPDPDRQTSPHVHQAVTSPGGSWILACDLGTDEVVVYRLDDGRPRPHSRASFAPGHGVRHLAFAPDGQHAYVVAELSSQLVACHWDEHTGILSPGKSIDSIPDPAPLTPTGSPGADRGDFAAARVRNYPGAVVVSRTGDHVYVTNRGADSIAVVDAATHTLAATVDCCGRWPRDASLSPDGRRLFVANEHSGTVVTFVLDDGVPVPDGPAIDFPGVTSVTTR